MQEFSESSIQFYAEHSCVGHFVVVDRHVTRYLYAVYIVYVLGIKSSFDFVGTLMVIWHGQGWTF